MSILIKNQTQDIPNFSVIVNGYEYKNCWKSIHWENSMDNFCGGFGVATLDFFEEEPNLWQIKRGAEYKIKVNDEQVGNGFIDVVNKKYGGNTSCEIEFMGRDKLCDIVDCPFETPPSEFKNQTYLNIIKEFCKPFDITVTVDPIILNQVSKIKKQYTIDEGRTIAEQIAELCSNIGVLPISTGDGKLTLTQSTMINYCADIISDTNILEADFIDSGIDRFSKYIVKREGEPEKIYSTDKEWIYKIKENKYSDYFEDSNIKRYRPYIITDDDLKDKQACKERAEYEANIRASKSKTVTYTLEGWTEVKSGKVWKTNKLVLVKDKKLGLDELMLINSVSATYDDSGYTISLQLIDKNCYSLNEKIEANTEFSQ